MKKIHVIIFGIISFLFIRVLPATAVLIEIDFDDLTNFEILDDQYSDLGVTFSNSAGDLLVAKRSFVDTPPFTPPFSVRPVNYNVWASYNMATFSVPVDYVSVTMGYGGGQGANLSLQLFNSSNTMVGSATGILSYAATSAVISAYASDYVAYARFYSTGTFHNWASTFDNFIYIADIEPVPEPSTIILLCTGLLGFAGFIRKKYIN